MGYILARQRTPAHSLVVPRVSLSQNADVINNRHSHDEGLSVAPVTSALPLCGFPAK